MGGGGPINEPLHASPVCSYFLSVQICVQTDQKAKQREWGIGGGKLLARSKGLNPVGYGSAGVHGEFCVRSILRSISRSAAFSGCIGGSCSSCVVEDIPDIRDRPLPAHKLIIHRTCRLREKCVMKDSPQWSCLHALVFTPQQRRLWLTSPCTLQKTNRL